MQERNNRNFDERITTCLVPVQTKKYAMHDLRKERVVMYVSDEDARAEESGCRSAYTEQMNE